MRHKALLAILLLAFAGCASSDQNGGPPIEVHAVPVGLSSDMLYFPGPMSFQFQVTANNPTDQPVRFQSIQLQTIGPGAFSLRSGTVNVNKLVAPHSSTAFTAMAWGRAAGGWVRQQEPVTLHGTAFFTGNDKKAFVRSFTEILQ